MVMYIYDHVHIWSCTYMVMYIYGHVLASLALQTHNKMFNVVNPLSITLPLCARIVAFA